jgi:uncharacterized protein DUF4411
MPVFCVDTNVWIALWRENYPIDVFPTLWTKLDEVIAVGEVVAPVDVCDELERQDDDLLRWVRQRPTLFRVADTATQNAVIVIMNQFPNWVDVNSTRNQADPWVVAMGVVIPSTVVTNERSSNGPRPKIPNVCEHFGVECIDLLAFIRRQGWTF